MVLNRGMIRLDVYCLNVYFDYSIKNNRRGKGRCGDFREVFIVYLDGRLWWFRLR